MIIRKQKVSEETKAKEKRGEGHGADYKPYIKVNEFNSLGTASNPVDWKTGRTMELLSQGEYYLYYILRFDDNVVDIREQFPLELEETLKIAKELGYKHPKNTFTRMTSDLLVDYSDGTQEVFSVKSNIKALDHPRTMEILRIEKEYWTKKGVKFNVILTDSLDADTVSNIRLIVEYYDKKWVHDEISLIKHLIATKQIPVSVTNGLINYSDLRKELANNDKFNAIISREYYNLQLEKRTNYSC